MSGTIKTVKEEFEIGVSRAISNLSRLNEKLRETKDNFKNSGAKQMAEGMNGAADKTTSAVESQVQKIALLKAQINGVTEAWKQAVSIATVINEKIASMSRMASMGDAGKGGAYEGMLTRMAQETELLYQELDKLSIVLHDITGSDFANGQADLDAWVTKAKGDIKLEEQALRDLQREQQGASASSRSHANATQKAASSHRSFGTALKQVVSVCKKVRSQLSSVLGGIRNFASSIKGAIPHSQKFGGALGRLASQFKRLFVMRLMRNLIMGIIRAFKEGTQNIAQYSKAMNGLDSNNANKAMSELASTGAYLKNVLGSAVIPVLNALLPIIRSVATGFATAVNYVNQFMSALGGKSSWTKAKSVTVDYASSLSDVGSSAGASKDAVEDLKRTILGFDEINKLNDAGSSGSGSGGGGGGGGSDTVNYKDMFEEVPIDNKVTQWLEELKPYIDAIKTAWDNVKRAISELTKSEGFKTLTGNVFKGILEGIALILDGIALTIDAFKQALDDPKILSKINSISGAWDKVKTSVKQLVESDAWKSVVHAVTFVGLTLLEGILTTISGLIDGLRKGIEKLDENGKLKEFEDAWNNVVGAMGNLFNAEGFQELESTVLYMIVTGLTGILDTLATLINGTLIPALNDVAEKGDFEAMSNAWSSIWTSIKNICDSELFKQVMSGALELGISGIATAIKLIADSLEVIEGFFTFDLEKSGKGLAKILMDIFDPIARFVTKIVDKVNELRGKPTHYEQDWADSTTAMRNAIDNDTTYQYEYNRLKNPVETPGVHASEIGGSHSGGGGSFGQGKADGEAYARGYGEGSKGINVPIDGDFKGITDKHGKFVDEVEGTVLNAPIGANITEAKKAARELKTSITNSSATLTVKTDISKAETTYTVYKDKVTGTELKAPVNADMTKGNTAYGNFKTAVTGTVLDAQVQAKMKTTAKTLYTDLDKDWTDETKDKYLPTTMKNTTYGSTLWKDISDRWKKSVTDEQKALDAQSKIATPGSTLWQQTESQWTNATSYKSLSVSVEGTLSNPTTLKSNVKAAFSDISVQVVGAGDLNKIVGNLYFQAFAKGGFLDTAQMFMARENGIPEYVGKFGSHTAVANNYQIVSGIAQGVSAAMTSQNELLREQNMLLTQIATQGSNVNVSSILSAMNRTNKRTGQPVVQMG